MTVMIGVADGHEEENAKYSQPTLDGLKGCSFWDSPAGRIFGREPQGAEPQDAEPQDAEPQGQDAQLRSDLVLAAEGGVRLVLKASGLLVVEGCEEVVQAIRDKLQLLGGIPDAD